MLRRELVNFSVILAGTLMNLFSLFAVEEKSNLGKNNLEAETLFNETTDLPKSILLSNAVPNWNDTLFQFESIEKHLNKI